MDTFDRYIPGNPQTWGVAVESGDRYLYYGISNWSTGKQIRVIDTNDDSEAALYVLSDTPYRLISDDQGRIFSPWGNSGKVQVYNNAAEAGFIDVNSEHTGCRPLDAAVTNDGAGIYVTCPNLNQARRFPTSWTQQESLAMMAMTMTQEVDDSATLILTGVPEGTRAYVDGLFPEEWNTDPDTATLTLYGVVPGVHAVRMMAPGYEIYDLVVEPAPYGLLEIPVTMTPAVD
ncbi:MAG: hypothetical protein P1S59_14105 [bacterium]|nr:hypothetical protein [bacterium]